MSSLDDFSPIGLRVTSYISIVLSLQKSPQALCEPQTLGTSCPWGGVSALGTASIQGCRRLGDISRNSDSKCKKILMSLQRRQDVSLTQKALHEVSLELPQKDKGRCTKPNHRPVWPNPQAVTQFVGSPYSAKRPLTPTRVCLIKERVTME